FAIRIANLPEDTARHQENADVDLDGLEGTAESVRYFQAASTAIAISPWNASVVPGIQDFFARYQSVPTHATRNVDTAGNQASAGARSAGGATIARNASRIQVAFTV
ncbi:unnamed protein product, partial [Callosobruchus maculatus]